MPKKTTAKNPFTGRWNIASMSEWDKNYLHEQVQAYIEFDAKGSGEFQVGHVQGDMDCRVGNRDGKPAVEFTWEGADGADGTPLTGRGWAILAGNELHGMIFFHQGDESDFVAKMSKRRPPKSGKRKRR